MVAELCHFVFSLWRGDIRIDSNTLSSSPLLTPAKKKQKKTPKHNSVILSFICLRFVPCKVFGISAFLSNFRQRKKNEDAKTRQKQSWYFRYFGRTQTPYSLHYSIVKCLFSSSLFWRHATSMAFVTAVYLQYISCKTVCDRIS